MLRLSHLILLLFCILVTIWGLVFFWQDDMNSYQCNSYLWLIGVPSSFAINLINMKAYRLASFLVADHEHIPGKKMKKKHTVSHLMVIFRTILMTIFTIVILGIVSAVDNPNPVKVIIDPIRPSYDYYVCQSKSAGSILVFLLVICHVIVSIICVGPVRNGFEAFRDGMVMKEAFILLYILVLLAYVMHTLGIQHTAVYVMRTSFLCLGLLLFVLRLLISRCARHWISEELQSSITNRFKNVYKIIPGNNTQQIMESVKSRKGSSCGGNSSGGIDEDSPLYAQKENSHDTGLEDMKIVFDDPIRYAMFRNICDKGLIIENVDFIEAVAQWKLEAAGLIVIASGKASNVMKIKAMKLIQSYLEVGSDNEVNISSATRTELLLNMKK